MAEDDPEKSDSSWPASGLPFASAELSAPAADSADTVEAATQKLPPTQALPPSQGFSSLPPQMMGSLSAGPGESASSESSSHHPVEDPPQGYGPPPGYGTPQWTPPGYGAAYPPAQTYGPPPGYGPRGFQPPGYQPPGYPPPAWPGASLGNVGWGPFGFAPPQPSPFGAGYAAGGIGLRIIALIIDAAFVFATFLLAGLLIGLADGNSADTTPAGMAILLLWMFFVLSYHPASWYVFDCTLGQRALGLRVRRRADGQSLGFGAVNIRYIVFCVETLIFPLGIIAGAMASGDPMKQTWHDEAAGSVVVKRL